MWRAWTGAVDFGSDFFTGTGQIGFLTIATATYILINTVVNAGADGIDFEDATIRLTGVHNVDASFFLLRGVVSRCEAPFRRPTQLAQWRHVLVNCRM